jgi:hypothetical protein
MSDPKSDPPLTDPVVPPMRDPPGAPYRDPVQPPPNDPPSQPLRDPDPPGYHDPPVTPPRDKGACGPVTGEPEWRPGAETLSRAA